jgi:hypothetical protein
MGKNILAHGGRERRVSCTFVVRCASATCRLYCCPGTTAIHEWRKNICGRGVKHLGRDNRGTFATRQPSQPARWSATTNDMISEQTHSEKANQESPRPDRKRGNTRATAVLLVLVWTYALRGRQCREKTPRSARRTVPLIGRYCAEDKRASRKESSAPWDKLEGRREGPSPECAQYFS